MMHTSRVPARPGCALWRPAARHRQAVPAASSDPTTWISRAPRNTEHPFLRAFYGQPADPDQRA